VADENDKPEVEQEDDLSNLSTKLSPVQFKMDGDDYELRYLTGETLGTYRNKFKDRVRKSIPGRSRLSTGCSRRCGR
jgi:hypothetical protein